MMKLVNLIIADINPAQCRLISNQLKLNKKNEIVGLANNIEEFMSLISTKRADIILMDFYVLGVNGTNIVRRILEEQPYLKIILMGDNIELSDLNDVLFTGAKGFVVKSYDESNMELEEAIVAVMKGGFYFSKNTIRQTSLKYG